MPYFLRLPEHARVVQNAVQQPTAAMKLERYQATCKTLHAAEFAANPIGKDSGWTYDRMCSIKLIGVEGMLASKWYKDAVASNIGESVFKTVSILVQVLYDLT